MADNAQLITELRETAKIGYPSMQFLLTRAADALEAADALLARYPALSAPDHHVCTESRDCIVCGKRIEPAGGLCFKCATTDPKVQAEAARLSALDAGDDDEYAIGNPALDLDGKWMQRCIKCGIPRGTLRHAARCMAKLCDDPGAGSQTKALTQEILMMASGLPNESDVLARTGTTLHYLCNLGDVRAALSASPAPTMQREA